MSNSKGHPLLSATHHDTKEAYLSQRIQNLGVRIDGLEEQIAELESSLQPVSGQAPVPQPENPERGTQPAEIEISEAEHEIDFLTARIKYMNQWVELIRERLRIQN